MKKMEIKRPIIVVGQPSLDTEKRALEFLGDEPIIVYANEYNIVDNFSIPKDVGILIKEVDYKPNIELIINTMLEYRGQVVLTSYNQKDVSKKIYGLCQLKRGAKAYVKQHHGGETAVNYELNIFEMFYDYLKNSDREEVSYKLKRNKPYDEQLLSWLTTNMSPNKLAYIDSKVKRRWSQDYFYELLSYSHNGKTTRKVIPPAKRSVSKIPSICRRVGLKSNEGYILKQLLEDEEFSTYVKKKVNNVERRTLKLGEKTRKKKVKIPQVRGLNEW